ncbi:MAG: thioredoxin-dependent thiol peroxidase [Trueperaceae bacterium]|nr:thioredoxin-dependent thiol peroxidase [Trueperaceae bacterium]
MLEVGQIAPDFSLLDQEGQTRSLADARGRWVVVYFYPKDDTPGCTKEACAFRDDLPRFEGLNAVVWGVSADDEKAHRKFAEKFALNFPLLVDPDKAVLEAYGAWVEKSMYGKSYMGVQRITYLIDPEGKVVQSWPKVKPEEHAEEVAAALAELQA